MSLGENAPHITLWPVPPNDQHDRTHLFRPCLPVRRPARCHRRDVELAENSEDVIDWLLVARPGPARRRMRRVVGRRGALTVTSAPDICDSPDVESECHVKTKFKHK